MKNKQRKRLLLLAALLVALLLVLVLRPYLRVIATPIMVKLGMSKTVAERLAQYGESARDRLRPYFEPAGISYPPERAAFVAFKDKRQLDLYVSNNGKDFVWIRSYKVLAASGELGPKLKEGDRQVPEGIYAIESLNPNSRFHLSLRVSYPNDFDQQQAKEDGRSNLGGDIMIHGNSVSVGCLAVGDEAAEDLFVLAADTGLTNLTVVISPVDFRRDQIVPNVESLPAWIDELYVQIQQELNKFPVPAVGEQREE
jgi:hypothetical protein